MFSRRIYVFGSLRVQDERGLRRLSGERVQSLLAYLVLHPRLPHRREMLAELLSPDASPERVRRNFSDTLYRLQKALSPDWLTVDGDTVALNAGSELWVDCWEFERLAASGQDGDLQRAVDLYTGDLIPEIYADWIEPVRELIRSQYIAALELLAKSSETQGRLQDALLQNRRIIQVDPLHEPAHQAYLRLLGRLQRYGEALAHYDYLCQLMRAELDAEPLAETQAVIQSIERERLLAAAPIEVEERTPFVGRIPERAAALSAVEAALEGRGGVLAIEGEAGIGKSRLLREILAGASWRGATVLQGGASQVPGSSPFSPLIEAFAPLLTSARAVQLETLLPAEILATLAPLFPGWLERMTPSKGTGVRTGAYFQNALRFFAETLARLAPLVLALDDLHWADPVLWESLTALSQGFIPNGALLLLVYRRPEIESTPGWRILQAWDRAGQLKTISLRPLSLAEVAQLVNDQSNADPEQIFSLTGGNPFQLTEWLADPSQSLSRGTAERLANLAPPALAALQAAAVLGENIPFRAWAITANISPLILAGLSEELVSSRWLSVSAEGYSFVHDLIRSAVYDEIMPAERRMLHGRAVRAYQELEPDNVRVLAFHLDRAGLGAEGAVAYRRAGEQDQGQFAFLEAQASYDRALALMPHSPSQERIEVAIALAGVCEVTGDRQRQRRALDEALAGARLLGNGTLLLQALLMSGRAASRTGNAPEAESQLEAALALARELQDRLREADALHYTGDLAGMQGKWADARVCYSQALQIARAIPDPAHEASASRGIAIAARFMGDLQESAAWLEQCLVLNRQIGDRLGEMTTQVNMLAVLYEMGAWDRLIAVADQAIPEAEAMGNRYSLARMRHNRSLAALALGDYAAARQLLAQAERDCEATGDLRLAGIVRNTLGLVAENEGGFEEALHLYRTALADAEALQAATELAYAQHDLGALLFQLGQIEEAIPLLQAAREAWSGLENILLRVKSEAFLGLALLASGELAAADDMAEQGWSVFQGGVPLGEQPQGWLWALHRLLLARSQPERAGEVLRTAFAELQRQALAIEDSHLRSSFFERVPLNRAIVSAYEKVTSSRHVVLVSLARREAPLGRALKEDERITVEWTIRGPEDEAMGDKTQLRRQRIKRLLEQAESQGAAPTDDDLAGALGVSRRTILRDLQAMAQALENPPTRKRKR